MHSCPLCQHQQTADFFKDERRQYLQCARCSLIFVDPAFRLDAVAEKAMYDLHENDPNDQRYRTFLSRFANPLLDRVGSRQQQGLDFGCGPGPTLSLMMAEQGHHVEIYDLYFYPDKSVLEREYDFVTCTEVMEHFYHPNKEWKLLLSLVKPGGWLGIMTKLARDVDAFSTWHYKSDVTHVSFFSKETFMFLAHRDQLTIEFVCNDVILLRKPQ